MPDLDEPKRPVMTINERHNAGMATPAVCETFIKKIMVWKKANCDKWQHHQMSSLMGVTSNGVKQAWQAAIFKLYT